jgi:hypothetical protein
MALELLVTVDRCGCPAAAEEESAARAAYP